MTLGDNYRICAYCGTVRSVMGDCAECYRVRQLTEANKSKSEVKADNLGTAILGGIAVLVFFAFGNSSPKIPEVNGPNSSYYVATKATLKQSLVPGTEYTSYSDGSCSKENGKVCLDHTQAERFCKEFDGVNTVDTKLSNFVSKNTDGKMSSGTKVKISNRQGTFIDQTYSFTGLQRGFSNNSCYLRVSVSGEYSGQSVTYVQVTSWKVNEDGKLVATSTSTAPENRAKNALGQI